MKKHHLFFLFIIHCLFYHPIWGQDGFSLKSGNIGSTGLSFETWKAGENRISEFTIPISYVYSPNDQIKFYLTTGPAYSSYRSGRKYGLDGMTDVKIGGHVLGFDDRWLFVFGLNLPTGKNALDNDEYPVARVLALESLGFRIPSLGQGFDVQVGLNTARDVGEASIGGGISCLIKGEFKPFSSYDETYTPGNEVSLTAGVNIGKITGDLIYTIYSDDKWDGQKVFRSGNRLIIQLFYSFRWEPLDMVLYVRDQIKGKNKSGSSTLFETERKNRNGNQFHLQLFGYFPTKNDFRPRGVLDIKIYSNNDYGSGGANLFGVGAGTRALLSPRVVFNGDIRWYFGKMVTGLQNVDVSGIKLYGGLQVSF